MHQHGIEWGSLGWVIGWLIAVGVLFVWGLRLRLASGDSSWRRRVRTIGLAVAAGAVCVLALAALTLHDLQFDLTRERLHTPAAQALEVAQQLVRPVRVTYYYQGSDPSARRALQMLRSMATENALLEVTGIDPDKQPSLARTAGVKLYNVALIETEGRRVMVHSTDEREFAIGIQRVLRERQVKFCFVEGHHEMPSENQEFQNEIEVAGAHTHDDPSSMIIETTAHGVGRWRRALQGLGYDAETIALALGDGVSPGCNAVIVAGPRRAFAPRETRALRRYLEAGGAAALLLDIGFEPDADLVDLLALAGIAAVPAVIVDTVSHFGTDAQSVAVTGYAPHAITRRVGYTFFPGARPLSLHTTPTVQAVSLVESSRHAELDGTHAAASATPAPFVIAAASEGRLPGADREFRLFVAGDVDFLANENFAQMSNSALALSMARWLVREEDLAPTAPHVHAESLILLTEAQLNRLYLCIVLLMPATAAALGVLVWWRRR